MRDARWVAVLLATILTAVPGARAAEGEQTTPVRRALLIGINDYAANDRSDVSGGADWIPLDLRGAINDLEKMRAVLTSRFGFEDGGIRVLKDHAATRDAILEAMRDIVKASGPDDVVYIHFSGHGSQVPDTNGDETDDGFDETILSHDARTGEVADITDDEIGEILSGFKTRSALIVLDSCHSGTATRDISAIRTRMVAADPRKELYARDKAATRSVGRMAAEYVLMTGAAEHQSALDGPIDGEFYGFFSYALGKALANAPAGATPWDVHASVLKEFERLAAHFGLVGMPEPQVEGPAVLTEQALLRSADARLAWATVRSVSEGTAILVRAVPLGASVGAMWAIYPPGETEFRPGAALATAAVIATTGDDATVRIEPADPPPPPGSRAVALTPPPASDHVPIRFDRVEPEMRADLERALRRRSPKVRFVSSQEFARFIIDVEGGVVRVYGAGGLQQVTSFSATSAETAADKIAEVLTRSASASALLSLDNPASALQLDVRVVPAGVDGSTRGIKVVAAADTPAYRMRREGEPRSPENSLMLELNVGQDSYVTVVDVDTEGGVNILFPNPRMKEEFYPEGRIPGGRPIRLPDSLQTPNRAGFFWDYGPPAGLDTVRVFAMIDVDSARKLRAFIGSLKPATATRGVAKKRATFNDLARELAATVTTRGIVVVADDHEQAPSPGEPQQKSSENPDWTAVSLTLVIEE